MALENTPEEQKAEEPQKQTVEEQKQAEERREGGGEGRSFEEVLASYLGVPPDVIKKAPREDIAAVYSVLEAAERAARLPQEARAALAPVLASRLMPRDEVEAALASALKYAAVLKALRSGPEEQLFAELMKRLLNLLEKQTPPPPPPAPPPPPPQQQPPPQQLDGQFIESVVKLKEAVDKLWPRREEKKEYTLSDLPNLLNTLRQFGFEIRPSAEALLKQVEREAYERGVQDGMRRAEVMKDVISKAVDALLALIQLYSASKLPAPPPLQPQAQSPARLPQQPPRSGMPVM
jgi:hypothetical protein